MRLAPARWLRHYVPQVANRTRPGAQSRAVSVPGLVETVRRLQVTCNSWAKARKNVGATRGVARSNQYSVLEGLRSQNPSGPSAVCCIAQACARSDLWQDAFRIVFHVADKAGTSAHRHVSSLMVSGRSHERHAASSHQLKVDSVGATAAVSASPRWRSSLACVATLRLRGCELAAWLSASKAVSTYLGKVAEVGARTPRC